jgi:hypothetical protein
MMNPGSKVRSKRGTGCRCSLGSKSGSIRSQGKGDVGGGLIGDAKLLRTGNFNTSWQGNINTEGNIDNGMGIGQTPTGSWGLGIGRFQGERSRRGIRGRGRNMWGAVAEKKRNRDTGRDEDNRDKKDEWFHELIVAQLTE